MTVWEKRTVERANNILVVTYRQGGNSHDYLLGITNNFSHKGINLETGRLEYNPGEVLELTLKHPYSEFSIEVVGEIVWKTEGWYKSTTGIKLRATDQDTDAKMKDLMSHKINVHDSPPSLQKHMEQAKAMEEEKAVVPESAANAEMIISHQDSSSIPKEDVSLPADEKTSVNVHTDRKENPCVKILKKTGLILIGIFASFTFVTVTTRVISSENDTKTELPGVSQGPTLVQGPPVLRKEITFDLNSDIISPKYHPEIDTFVKALLSKPDAVLLVEGYADSIGEELYNLDLAMRRAWKVKKLLLKKGVHEKRVKVAVYGESSPLSPDNDESESPRDRRVDLLLVPYGGSI